MLDRQAATGRPSQNRRYLGATDRLRAYRPRKSTVASPQKLAGATPRASHNPEQLACLIENEKDARDTRNFPLAISPPAPAGQKERRRPTNVALASDPAAIRDADMPRRCPRLWEGRWHRARAARCWAMRFGRVRDQAGPEGPSHLVKPQRIIRLRQPGPSCEEQSRRSTRAAWQHRP